MTKYKFDNVHEWFNSWLLERPTEELFSIANQLASALDADKLQDIFQSDMSADGYFTPDEELEDEEPDDDAITTEDHIHFYLYGKLVFTLDEDEDRNLGIKRELDRMQFWPNVFFISDHGNAHLIKYWE